MTGAVVLRFPGVLRGMGKVASCVLETWQEESTSGRMFTRCRIVDEPQELPDGLYELEVANRLVANEQVPRRMGTELPV